jgi:hypothetical protein
MFAAGLGHQHNGQTAPAHSRVRESSVKTRRNPDLEKNKHVCKNKTVQLIGRIE